MQIVRSRRGLIGLSLGIALAASSGRALGNEPDEGCAGPPTHEAWIAATIVSVDYTLSRCAMSRPGAFAGAGTGACIAPSASVCQSPVELVVDGVVVGGTGVTCVAAGRHEVAFCGTSCAEADFPAGTSVLVRIEEVLPRMVVRVDRVFDGPADLRGQTLESGFRRPGMYDYAPGQSIEIRWTPDRPRVFALVEGHCRYARFHPGAAVVEPNADAGSNADAGPGPRPPSPPGCSRCDGGGAAAGSLPGMVVLILAMLVGRWRHREVL